MCSHKHNVHIQTHSQTCRCACICALRYKKGSHAKGRNVFLKDIEPFIKWLEEAEEDADDDDDE